MIFDQILVVVDFLQKELLLFASLCFLIGSLDDLVFDAIWLTRAFRRKLFVYTKFKKFTSCDMPRASADESVAVFVPAWQEAPVISAMVQRCLDRWNPENFRLYIGCYKNDSQTMFRVMQAASTYPNIRIVICDRPGPTSKADCLNRLWKALCKDEIAESKTYKAIVLHDAEDYVHPESLNVYLHLIKRASLVQLPVIPRRTSKSKWIAGHYGDEFAEMHGKQMVLREALGVSIPSAGVGCAFERNALGLIAARKNGNPFDASSQTEDYELGIQITSGKARGIFARIADAKGNLVATEEFFPDQLEDAVRQKSRWMTGIALAGWDRLGWQSGWRENWMRIRDRKSSLAAIVLALAYLGIILTGILILASIMGWYQQSLITPMLVTTLWINAIFLAWRLIMRAVFVYRIYGMSEALLSAPRAIIGNIINILAARRAFFRYFSSLNGAVLDWEKTKHFVPSDADIKLLKTSPTRILDDSI